MYIHNLLRFSGQLDRLALHVLTSFRKPTCGMVLCKDTGLPNTQQLSQAH